MYLEEGGKTMMYQIWWLWSRRPHALRKLVKNATRGEFKTWHVALTILHLQEEGKVVTTNFVQNPKVHPLAQLVVAESCFCRRLSVQPGALPRTSEHTIWQVAPRRAPARAVSVSHPIDLESLQLQRKTCLKLSVHLLFCWIRALIDL